MPFLLGANALGAGALVPAARALQVNLPQQGSVSAGPASWATVLMGKRDASFDAFWELFVLREASGSWSLVTPPGVADNGGLFVAPEGSGAAALAGFGASQLLKFSPLALSANAGRSWSPAGLPRALVAEPSSLALGPRGAALALVSKNAGQEVLAGAGALTSWTNLVSTAALSKTSAGKRCALGAVQAVALGAGGTRYLAGSCRRAGVADIFSFSAGSWRLVSLRLPASLGHAQLQSLRLTTSDGITSGLLLAGTQASQSLLATWAASSKATWLASAPLGLQPSTSLVATGVGPGGLQFVLLRSKSGVLSAAMITGPRARWQDLPRLPAQTATLAFSASRVDALVVNDTLFVDWRLAKSGTSWEKVQSMQVPIGFSSSS